MSSQARTCGSTTLEHTRHETERANVERTERSEDRGDTVHKFLVLGLLLATPVLAQDQTADLRAEAGCGPAKTKFDVKVDKKQHVVTQPEAGKALMYVFEEYQSDPRYPPLGHVTTRVGWAGKRVAPPSERPKFPFPVELAPPRTCPVGQPLSPSPGKSRTPPRSNPEAEKI